MGVLCSSVLACLDATIATTLFSVPTHCLRLFHVAITKYLRINNKVQIRVWLQILVIRETINMMSVSWQWPPDSISI